MPLNGKTVALSGATGGIGKVLCRRILHDGGRLLLLDRNAERSHALRTALLQEYPNAAVECIPLDLSDFDSVKAAVEALKEEPLYALILNAGVYSVPRFTCRNGRDNVYQINCVSPYYLVEELLPTLRRTPGSRVVAVGSIAHRYSATDRDDIDFTTRTSSALVYGNSKRRLMFGLWERFRRETEVGLIIAHPGITFTNITAHYPPWLFAIIKYPMKLIFMKPKHAALSIVRGLYDTAGYHEWIGPALFDVWGCPKKRVLRSCPPDECRHIADECEADYTAMKQLTEG